MNDIFEILIFLLEGVLIGIIILSTLRRTKKKSIVIEDDLLTVANFGSVKFMGPRQGR